MGLEKLLGPGLPDDGHSEGCNVEGKNASVRRSLEAVRVQTVEAHREEGVEPPPDGQHQHTLGEHKPGRIKPGRIKKAVLSLRNQNYFIFVFLIRPRLYASEHQAQRGQPPW